MIREIKASDIPVLARMIVAYWHEFDKTDQDAEIEDAAIQQFSRFLDSPHDESYVSVSDEDEIQGFICLHWIPFPIIKGTECYVSDLLVSQNSRGKGVGQQLLDKAELLARGKGCTRLMLNNRKEADSYKRSFYAKQGFKERDVIANFVKMLED